MSAGTWTPARGGSVYTPSPADRIVADVLAIRELKRNGLEKSPEWWDLVYRVRDVADRIGFNDEEKAS